MKKLVFFAAAMLAMGAMGAASMANAQTTTAQAQTAVRAKVTEATVFLQGAELTQTAVLTLKKGVSEITIEGLSPDVVPGSLKTNISGGVVVSAFDYATDYLGSPKTPPARLRMLKDSIDIYTAQVEKTRIDIEVNENLEKFLDMGLGAVVSYKSEEKTALTIDELRKTIDYASSKGSEILNGRRELKLKRDKIDKDLTRVRNQYNQEAGVANRPLGVVNLTVSAPAAGNYPVVVTYFTPLALWTPYYDINAASTSAPIAIAAKARVSQTTGLDWDNVKPTLSTSMPSGGSNVAPLFSAWMLRQKTLPRQLQVRAMAVQNSYSYDMIVMEEAAEMPAPKTMYDYVSTAQNALNVTYNIDLPYSIAGNGKEQTIDLSEKTAAAEYKYYSAPKLDGATYLLAEIADWQQLELLSAPANITYAGTYSGETWINAASTDKKLALTLGTDKRVVVERELMKDFSAAKTLGSNKEQIFAYKMTVRNGQNVPIQMVLKDQYPISTDKSIVVTLNAAETTPWTANVAELGVLTWEETIPAGTTKTYTLSYTVKYPKDMELDL